MITHQQTKTTYTFTVSHQRRVHDVKVTFTQLHPRVPYLVEVFLDGKLEQTTQADSCTKEIAEISLEKVVNIKG